ncbi:MAG: arginyltransferase [Gammaproteobacteria bacterium]|nr:arginyltransferase [Gammaproteobacteria bacterium]
MIKNSEKRSSISLFRTSDHACSYKEDHRAATIFLDPTIPIHKSMNSRLSFLGFRRSGSHLYKPDCSYCNACISCRIPTNAFKFKNSYRRILNKNKDLNIVTKDNLTNDSFYLLYERYINDRHADGDMYPVTREQFEAFIKTKTTDTHFTLFYLKGTLIAVSVTDILENGISAVYTYFDPNEGKRSLGIHSILYQVQLAITLNFPYVYLGYWIKDCQNMKYKLNFRPIEMLINDEWVLIK